MMELLPGSPGIITTLPSHLLFINLPSTILAWDQIKEDGKDFGFQLQNRGIRDKGEIRRTSTE